MFGNNSNILNIGAFAPQDDSIIKKDFHTYTPNTNSLSESEEIRIAIQNQDLCLLPSESYLYMQFQVITENYNETEAEKVMFTRNFPSFLFSDGRYELNGVEIDRIRNVGITSTMKLLAATCQSNVIGYHRFNEAFTGKIAQNKVKEILYDVMIPLSIYFGFCEDNRKVILNCRHELILIRARNSLNCVHGGKEGVNTTNVKIKVTKLEWKMPHILLNHKVKVNMNNFLSKHKKLPIQFRSWDLHEYPELPQTTNHVWTIKTVPYVNKPRYVLVGFQTDKKERKTEDASKFRQTHINSVRLHLNSSVYPYHMHEVDIGGGLYSELYEAYANIQSSYYNGAEGRNLFANTFAQFQSDVIYAFDASRSDELLTTSNGVDIRF